ncbi:phosphate ABC transporter substrate-binding protein [Roseibium hamelinense]|nr:phosphate ABC transporter substrate-binding protein [Roseibium hamelinense]
MTLLSISVVFAGGAVSKAEDFQRFKMGIVVGKDPTVRERIEPFRKELEFELDRPVDLFLIDTLGELVDAISAADIHYARLSPSAYATSDALCSCVEPLVTARPDELEARYFSILVGKAREIRPTIEDLKGGRIGVQSPSSVTGYRVPLANLAAEGIDPRSFFKILVRTKDPLEALHAVLDGRIDAAFVWSTLSGKTAQGYSAGTLNELYISGASGLEKLDVYWRSPAIPYSAHTVQKALPDALKRKLRAFLVDLRDSAPDAYFAVEPDYPGGLEPVVHSDFRAVLRTYDPGLQDILVP